MSVSVLKRIRHYPERFRHVRRTWVLGGGGGASVSLAGEIASLLVLAPKAPNTGLDFNVNWVTAASSGSTAVSVDAFATQDEIATAVAAALQAEAGITASATGNAVTADCTPSTWVSLEFGGVAPGTFGPGPVPGPVKFTELDVEYKPDMHMGDVLIYSKADTDSYFTLRLALNSGSMSQRFDLSAGMTKVQIATMVAQTLNADDRLSADRSGSVVSVIGQGSNVLNDITVV